MRRILCWRKVRGNLRLRLRDLLGLAGFGLLPRLPVTSLKVSCPRPSYVSGPGASGLDLPEPDCFGWLSSESSDPEQSSRSERQPASCDGDERSHLHLELKWPQRHDGCGKE